MSVLVIQMLQSSIKDRLVADSNCDFKLKTALYSIPLISYPLPIPFKLTFPFIYPVGETLAC